MTRDPKRIPIVLEAIKKLWEIEPNLRLGQLVYVLTQFYEINEKDTYYIEDDELIKKIIKALKIKHGIRWEPTKKSHPKRGE